MLKNYFSKFTDLDSLIKEYTAENYIDLKGLKDIQDQMNEALAEYDIEMFYPPLQEDYSSSKGISDVTKVAFISLRVPSFLIKDKLTIPV